MDKVKIVSYNCIEALILGLLIGTSLQSTEISTVIFLVVASLMLLPHMLAENMDKRK